MRGPLHLRKSSEFIHLLRPQTDIPRKVGRQRREGRTKETEGIRRGVAGEERAVASVSHGRRRPDRPRARTHRHPLSLSSSLASLSVLNRGQ